MQQKWCDMVADLLCFIGQMPAKLAPRVFHVMKSLEFSLLLRILCMLKGAKRCSPCKKAQKIPKVNPKDIDFIIF